MDYSKNWKRIIESILLFIMALACLFFIGVLIYFGVSKIIYKGVTAFFGFSSSLSENFILAFLGVALWIFLYAVAILVYTSLIYCFVGIVKFFLGACRGEKITKEKLVVYIVITLFCLSFGLYVSIINIPHFWGYLTSIALGVLSFICFVLCDGFKNLKKQKKEKVVEEQQEEKEEVKKEKTSKNKKTKDEKTKKVLKSSKTKKEVSK